MIDLPADATAEDLRATVQSLDTDELQKIAYDWSIWARPEQRMPAGDWRTWLVMAGRGWGKTRTSAEAVRETVHALPPGAGRIAIVAPTSADCRDVLVEGESGILRVFPPSERPVYEPSKRRVTFYNGVQAFCYSAEEPERLRGPQHHAAFCDEVAVYPQPKELFDNLRFGLRLGTNPRIVCTTTPRAGSKLLRDMVVDSGTIVTRGSTFDNRDLPAATLAEFERVYGGTRIGRQELEGELLEEAEGALWRGADIEALRVKTAPELVRVVVAIDPSVTSGPESDEVGIIAAGVGVDGHGYILRDLSGRMSPDEWARRAVTGFDYHDADKIIAESNNGGDLIISVVRTVRANIPIEKVHASRGKITRAEPVAALYEQKKVHHVGGFPELENELTTYDPGVTASPNRMDALVWALSFLMLKPAKVGRVLSL